MLSKILLAAACGVLLAACATTGDQPGWTGQGAQPFDGAQAQCQQQSMRETEGAQRRAAFEACMAHAGWQRLQGDH